MKVDEEKAMDRKTYIVSTNEQFYIFFPDENAFDNQGRINRIRGMYRAFLDTFNAEKGFGVVVKIGNDGRPYYRLFTESYSFAANKKCDRDDKNTAIGFMVNSFKPVSQEDTLDSSVRRVLVTGVLTENICVLGKNRPIDRNGFGKFLAYIERNALSYKHPDREDIVIKRQEAAEKMNFLLRQKEIITAKKEYDREFLKALQYSAWKSTGESRQDGTVRAFQIFNSDTESWNRFNVGAKVAFSTRKKITFQEERELTKGTVVRKEGTELFVKFNNLAQIDVPPNGYILELLGPDYGYKLSALGSLEKGESVNTHLLDILVKRTTMPIVRHVPYKKPSDVDALTDSQKLAVQRALEVDDFLLVQGPPGTGKTTIITEMIREFVKDGQRVLVCSQNNLAVDNVLEKCNERDMLCLRLGNEENIRLDSVRQLLPRYITEQLEKEIMHESRTTAAAYMEEVKKEIRMLQKAYGNTVLLCDAVEDFVSLGRTLRVVSEALDRHSIFSLLLGREKLSDIKNKVSGGLTIVSGYQQIVLDLVKKGKISVRGDALREQARILDGLFESMAVLYNYITDNRVRFSLILGQHRQEIISEIEKSILNRKKIYTAWFALENYEGNPFYSWLPFPSLPEEQMVEYLLHYPGLIEQVNNNASARLIVFNKILANWVSELEQDQSSFEATLLRIVKIIGATCIGAQTNPHFKNVEYDVVIVDEAGQIPMENLFVPLVKAKKIILIGDHMQLPPMGEQEFCEYVENNRIFDRSEYFEEVKDISKFIGKNYSQSLFERLFRDFRKNGKSQNIVVLDQQFRMHPVIAEFIKEYFYEGQYQSDFVKPENKCIVIGGFHHNMYFFDTGLSKEKAESRENTSYFNEYEAKLCAVILCKIICDLLTDAALPEKNRRYGKVFDARRLTCDIGVITAYSPQIAKIRKYTGQFLMESLPSIESRNPYFANNKGKTEELVNNLAIETLDSFQGRDNQIIIYSFVRSHMDHQKGGIGFLNEVRRLNVMMTRAKSLLIMVGDANTLISSKKPTVHDPDHTAGWYFDNLINFKGMHRIKADTIEKVKQYNDY